MNKRAISGVVALLSLFAIAFLAQLPGIGPASGQTIPVTFTPDPNVTELPTTTGTVTPTTTTTPFAVCVDGTPFVPGATPPAIVTGVACVTPTNTATSTATRTPTRTPTNTPTPTAVPFFFNVTFNYYADNLIRVFFNPAAFCVASNYQIEVDYGDGRPIAVLALPPEGCTPNASPYMVTPPAPNYPAGQFVIVATLRQTNPPAQARVIATSQITVNTGPTATPTITQTPTRTSTPFVVTNRQFAPRVQR